MGKAALSEGVDKLTVIQNLYSITHGNIRFISSNCKKKRKLDSYTQEVITNNLSNLTQTLDMISLVSKKDTFKFPSSHVLFCNVIPPRMRIILRIILMRGGVNLMINTTCIGEIFVYR